jgi:CheY-like chemotaxis protein
VNEPSTTRSVLIVDDHELNVKLMRSVLRLEGFEVRTASSADDALRSLDECVPDLVVMDVQLPGRDGLTLTRELRADERFRSLRIVAVTSYAMADDRERAMRAGCDAYFSKPIDTRTFGPALHELLGK